MLVSLVPPCLSWSSVHQCISRCGCAVGVLQLSRYFPYYLLIDWMGTWRRWARTQARQDGRSPVPHCTGGQPQYIVDGDCGIVTCYIERLWVVCNSLQLQCKLLYAHKRSKTGFDPKRANKKCHGVCANLLPLVAQRVEKSQHDSVFVERCWKCWRWYVGNLTRKAKKKSSFWALIPRLPATWSSICPSWSRMAWSRVPNSSFTVSLSLSLGLIEIVVWASLHVLYPGRLFSKLKLEVSQFVGCSQWILSSQKEILNYSCAKYMCIYLSTARLDS